jgi:rfaE bifunctional protein kinase chain/domain
MNLTELLDRAPSLRILVLGDYILDRYIDGVVERISPEAPVQVLRVKKISENPGGAANVAANLRGLGCNVEFTYNPVDPPIKTRVMSGSHHLLRMDEEGEPTWMTWENIQNFRYIEHEIKSRKYDCVVLSDYGKGSISRDVAKNVIALCRYSGANIPVVVDTKDQQNIFGGATLVKCNMQEWRKCLDRGITNTEWNYLKLGEVNNLVVTDGANGIHHWDDYSGPEQNGHTPGIKTNICDPCGAGDTVTAVLAITTALKVPLDEACALSNFIAAEVCKRPGVYAIKRQDLVGIEL